MNVPTSACRKRDRLICLALLLLVALTVNAAPVVAFDLITAEEARLMKKPFTRGSGAVGLGPSINIYGPEAGIHNPSPFELKIYFKGVGGATIDPNSIKILYWTDPRRDLTSRFMPFYKDNVILIPGATAPRGQHQIQISVTDSKEYKSKVIYDFQVD